MNLNKLTINFEELLKRLKGMLLPIFCIHVNTHSDRKYKIMLNLFKKTIFKKSLIAFIDLFYRYHYIRYFIYLDCM